MPIRTMKPGAFRSRSLSKCPIEARWTFAGLWTEADAHGRGVADAMVLKGALYSRDPDITHLHVSAHIRVLAATGHLTLYRIEEDIFYQINRWEKHQAASYRRGDPQHPGVDAGQILDPSDLHDEECSRVQPAHICTPMSAVVEVEGSGREGKKYSHAAAVDTDHAPADAVASEAPLEAELVDRQDVLDDGLFKADPPATVEPAPVNAGLLVKELIDEVAERGVTLTGDIIKRHGAAIKRQLDEHMDPDLIRAGLRLMIAENLHESPHLLPKKIVAAQTGPRLPPAQVPRSVNTERVGGWLAQGRAAEAAGDAGPFAAIGGAA